MQPDPQALLDTIAELAIEIARRCPDCADEASRLASLVGQLRGVGLDRGAVQDAIEAETFGSDISDSQARNAAEAVLRNAREDR